MKNRLDEIVYPGSDQYSSEELAAPGTVPVQLADEPILKACGTAYIMFEVPDLDRQKRFLNDFGMLLAEQTEDALFMRGFGGEPYIYAAHKAKTSRFIGAGFHLQSEEDLNRIAADTGNSIESVDSPGGGSKVRLTDPDGFVVDLVWERSKVEPFETRREVLPVNLPNKKNRVNQGQRPALEASALERFGHYVLMVTDFEKSLNWYQRHLGLLPTDVLCTATGRPVLAFCRLNLGDQPADHHTIVLASGPSASLMHCAFEALDIDSLGQGQQYLKQKGWDHFWGIGRHVLGSQVFDYWLDPNGFEFEHYADGDVFDASWPTQYHLIDRGGLWAWGEDVPYAIRPKPRLRDIVKMLTSGADWRQMMLEIRYAMARRPRPWLK